MTLLEEKNRNSVFRDAADLIESSDAIVILAGAGMGVDSGLPDYRGDDGLWREYPRLKDLGLSFSGAANPQLFADNPKLAWQFYGHRQALYRQTKPHEGFHLLRHWSLALRDGCFVYTSNVDGHFQFADFDPASIVECHGNIHLLQCCAPCTDLIWQLDRSWEPAVLDLDELTSAEAAASVLPVRRCPKCGKTARPNVMMFGDWDWISGPSEEQNARFHDWLSSLQKRGSKVCLIEIGAGSTLPAVRRKSQDLLDSLDARLIRINPDDADGPPGTISIGKPGLEALEQIDQALSSHFRALIQLSKDSPQEVSRRPVMPKTANEYLERSLGGFLPTVSTTHLRSLKGNIVYTRPLKVTVTENLAASIDRFEMSLVHIGALEGVPGRDYLRRHLNDTDAYVASHWSGPRHKVISPEIFDEHSYAPILPPIRCIAELSAGPRNSEEEGSWLTIVWWTSLDGSAAIVDLVKSALVSVDWGTDAHSYWV